MTASPGKRRPVVFGEVLFDCFEDGSRVLGGAPFNVAWHLAGFGLDPLLVSRVGDDAPGREVRRAMDRHGMDAGALQVDAIRATGEVQVVLEAGQPGFDIVDDRAFDHIEPPKLATLEPALVYHGTLALRHAKNQAALDTLVDTTAAPVFVDVNLRDPWWTPGILASVLGRARWAKLNDVELGRAGRGGNDSAALAAKIVERHGLERIIVTRGEHGAFSLDSRGERTETPGAAAAAVVDTVGAGDAFAAVCILGLMQGWDFGLVLERAHEFALVLVGQRGAVIDDNDFYSELANRWA